MADCDLSQFDRKLNKILDEVKALKQDVKRLESGDFVFKRLLKSDFLGEIRRRVIATSVVRDFLFEVGRQALQPNNKVFNAYISLITGQKGREAIWRVIRGLFGWGQRDNFQTGLQKAFQNVQFKANLGASAESNVFTLGDLYGLISKVNRKIDVNSVADNFKKVNLKLDVLLAAFGLAGVAVAVAAKAFVVALGAALKSLRLIDVNNEFKVNLKPVLDVTNKIENKLVGIEKLVANFKVDFAPVLNGIKDFRLDVSTKFNQTIGVVQRTELNLSNRIDSFRIDVSGKFNIVLQAMLNLNASLTATINARLAPVLQAIANIRLDLSPTLNAVNNLNIALTGTINARATAILAAIANIRFDISPTLNAIVRLEANLNATINARATAILNAIAVIGVAIARLEANLTAEIQLVLRRIDLKPLERKVDDVLRKLSVRIQGVLTYKKCDETIELLPYDGEGLEGLASLGSALSQILQFVGDEICEQNQCCVPLLPGEHFEEYKVPTQLVLTFGTEYPTQKGSLWHMSLPLPLAPEAYDWCRDFEPLSRTLGKVLVRCYWGNFTQLWTGGYFASEEEATTFFAKLLSLTAATPATDEDDGQYLRVYKGKTPKRKPRNRLVRCVRVVWVEIDQSTNEPINTYCWTPPRTGC